MRDDDRQDNAAEERAARLADAEGRLHRAISELTQAFLRGSAIERAEARDRFQEALAEYSGLVDAE